MGKRISLPGGRERTYPAHVVSDSSVTSLAWVSRLQTISDLPLSAVFWDMKGIAVLKLRPQASSISSPVRAANSQALPGPLGSETGSGALGETAMHARV